MSHRWIKFWPQDWQSDPAVRMCGLAARGLWMELLCIAHEGLPYGHVTVNSRAPTNKQIALLVGVSEGDVTKLLSELEEAGVFSRTGEGVIFSRRMVRDGEKSEEGRSHARNRWANGGDDGTSTGKPTQQPNAPPNGSPNSLEARSKKQKQEARSTPPNPLKGAEVDFERFWKVYPLKKAKADARKAFAKAIRKTTIEAILVAIERTQWPADPKFQPHPATWLNGERWLDQADAFDPVLRAVGLTPEDMDEPMSVLQ